jgi:hypothetical protein
MLSSYISRSAIGEVVDADAEAVLSRSGPYRAIAMAHSKGYYKEDDLVEEAVDFEVLLFERGGDYPLLWLPF